MNGSRKKKQDRKIMHCAVIMTNSPVLLNCYNIFTRVTICFMLFKYNFSQLIEYCKFSIVEETNKKFRTDYCMNSGAQEREEPMGRKHSPFKWILCLFFFSLKSFNIWEGSAPLPPPIKLPLFHNLRAL